MKLHFTDKCVGCGQCVDNCVTQSIKIQDGRIFYNEENCTKCGQCFAICPHGAVEMFGCDPSIDIHKFEQIEQIIAMRRSYRKYKKTQIDKTLILDLLNLTRFCPSSKNQRLVQFAILNKQVLDELRPLVEQYVVKHKKQQALIMTQADPIFRGVPLIILAIVPKGTSVDDGVIALATFEMAAQAKDLGTFWCGHLKNACQTQAVKSVIGISDDIEVVGAMGVGWPDVEFFRPAARPHILYRVVE